jgi:hypothetical protein
MMDPANGTGKIIRYLLMAAKFKEPPRVGDLLNLNKRDTQ